MQWFLSCFQPIMAIEVPVLGAEYQAHLDLLAAQTDFLSQWDRLGTTNQRIYRAVLCSIEALRRELKQAGGMTECHKAAKLKLKACLEAIPEKPFPKSMQVDVWLRYSQDPEAVATAFLQAWERLERFFLTADVPYVMRWNSIKSSKTIWQKIEAYEREGKDLDLWDMVRFRTSVASAPALRRLSEQILASFRDDVCRVRNYYVLPRGGDDDSYRAVHFELVVGETSFELQVHTVARDLIGLLDHDLTGTKRVAFLHDAHREWLEELRMAANIYDASRL